MTTLIEDYGFVAKGGKGGKSSHKTGDEQEPEGIVVDAVLKPHSEIADQETPDNVHNQGLVREGAAGLVMSPQTHHIAHHATQSAAHEDKYDIGHQQFCLHLSSF